MSPPSDLSPRAWIVGRWFDLLLLSNLWWPLAFLVGWQGEGFDGREGLQFWQIYFVTTPHRWITLGIVFLDRERFGTQPGLFLGLMAAVCIGCLAVLFTTGSLTCLLAIEYAWNMWHFAAQHHGVYRIYGRLSQREPVFVFSGEKVLMRLFLLYVMGRVAGGIWSLPDWENWLQRIDWGILAIPAALVASELTSGRLQKGRFCYLVSLLGLYLGLLGAVHFSWPAVVLALATASAMFHAMEYLAIVSWSVNRRATEYGSRLGTLAWVAQHGGIVMTIYVVLLGVGGWLIDREWIHLWLTLNLMAAFLHYIYDGIIWKGPRRNTTQNGQKRREKKKSLYSHDTLSGAMSSRI